MTPTNWYAWEPWEGTIFVTWLVRRRTGKRAWVRLWEPYLFLLLVALLFETVSCYSRPLVSCGPGLKVYNWPELEAVHFVVFMPSWGCGGVCIYRPEMDIK